MDEFITIDEFINTRYQIQIETVNSCIIKNIGYKNVNYSILISEFKMDKYNCHIISHTLDEKQLLDNIYNCISILIMLNDILHATIEFVFIPMTHETHEIHGTYELYFIINDNKHKLKLPDNFDKTNIIEIMIEYLADEKIVLMLF